MKGLNIKQSLIISFLSFFQIGISFLFQFFILRIFNISENLDIYIASNTINLIIVGVATGVLNYGLTPIFVKYYKKRKLKAFKNIANSLFNILFIIFLILAIFQYTFSVEITSFLFPGYTGESNILIAQLFAIQAFISILSISIGILNAINYTFNNLYRTIVIPIVASMFQIVFVYFSYELLGIISLVYALALNQLILFIGLSGSVIKHYQFSIKINDELKDSFRKMYPLILSSTFSKSDILVDRYFASALVAGSISILHYGQLFISTLTSLVNKGISLVSLRKFSLIENDKDKFNNYFLDLYQIMLVISMFFVLGVIISSDIVLSFILSKEGGFEEKIDTLYLVTISFIGIFIGGILSSVLVNAFYAKGLTVIVSKMSIILHTVGVVVKIIAFKLFGFYALPVVVSVKSIVGSVILIVLYNRTIYNIEYSKFLGFFIKNLLFTFLLLLASLWLKYKGFNIVAIVLFSSFIYISSYYRFFKNKFNLMRLK